MSLPVPPSPSRRDTLAALLFRLRLFLVSYAPLAGVFAWQSRTGRAELAWGVVVIVGLLTGGWTTYGQLRRGAHPVTVTDVSDRSGDVAGYLASYLLPFIAGPPSSVRQVGAYVTFFLVAALISLRSRTLTLLNPTLYLLGWSVLELQAGGRNYLALCRDTPVVGATVQLVTSGSVAIRKDRPAKGSPA